MGKSSFGGKHFSRSLIWVLGFIAFLALTFSVSWKYFEKRAEEDVSNTTPESFPVVVVTQNKSELVFINKLEKYKQENPNYTFLISNEDLVNRQLQDDQKRRGGRGTPKITVKPISEGRQLIEFEIVGDKVLNVKYEAADKDFKPLAWTVIGPLFSVLVCGAALLCGFVGFGLLNLVLGWLRKRKNRALV